MKKSRSAPQLYQTRHHPVRDHIGNAIPGYMGHVPGHRIETTTFGQTFVRDIEASRNSRTRHTINPQTHRLDREESLQRTASAVAKVKMPYHDERGQIFPPAGDTKHSRVPTSHEEKVHFQSAMGLTSLAHEGLGGAGHVKGYGRSCIGIPGYKGYVPGKYAHNIYGDTWSKSHERSLGAHFHARSEAPKKWSVITEGCTLTSGTRADAMKEVSLMNPSYQDRVRGWSSCEFSGTHVDPAGRQAPRHRQEGFGGVQPPLNSMIPSAPIHGYAGYVPGRIGENVVGERQCKTHAVSHHLFHKNRMRITQR